MSSGPRQGLTAGPAPPRTPALSSATEPAGTLIGEHITYRLRRVREAVGSLVLPLDVVASVDEALDDLVRLEGDLGADQLLRMTPYFGTLWPSARALTRWLDAHEGWLAGRSVLELGCGLAVPAILAARHGARVVATDRHADVAPLLARNTELSGVAIAYRSLDWTDLAQVERLAAELGRVDLVLASDVLYEADVVDALVPTLAALCAPGTRVVLTDPGRAYLQSAVNRIDRAGFTSQLEILRVADDLADAAVGGAVKDREIFLIEFTRV